MNNISELKNSILSKVQISTIISKFVKLKKAGKEFLGSCPFHSEKSPSFSVNDQKGIFKCFGCGASGDVIAFVMDHQKINFIDALNLIATSENIPIQYEANSQKNQQSHSPLQNMNFVKKHIVEETLSCYDQNPFAVWLAEKVGFQRALSAMLKYFVGTAREKGTIFWLVDQFLRVRTAQKIHYDQTGHRIKNIIPLRLFKAENNYHPCLFGEHLLFQAAKDDVIGIVESEKTAVICSLYLPEVEGRKVIWLACSGMNGLTEEKIWALRGMNVMLAPDFGFLSRMHWGVIPMRKMNDPADGRLKPHPDGEIDPEFVSRGALLSKLGCKVSFYDPFPDQENKSDLADYLPEFGVLPEEVAAPDFEELSLPVEGF